MRLSPSKLTAADKCLRSLQYDIRGPPEGWPTQSGISRDLGTAFHAVHEFAYGEAPALPTIEKLHRVGLEKLEQLVAEPDLYVWTKKIPDLDAAKLALRALIERYYEGDETRYWPVFGWDQDVDWRVLGIETRFEIPDASMVGPYTGEVGKRTGQIDLVLLDPNDWVVVVDHKTTGRTWSFQEEHPRKKPQPPLYVAAARDLWPGHAGYRFVFDVMTYRPPTKERPEWTADFDRRVADPTLEHEQAAFERGRQVIRLVDSTLPFGLDLPGNPASTMCKPDFCDHFGFCPFGAALETESSSAA